MLDYFRVVALDLDGTLASNGRVSATALAAVDSARASGMAVILATGRIGSELRAAFPGLVDHFDALVLENGAVIGTGADEHPIAPPVDLAVEKELADAGAHYRRGLALLAISGKDAAAAVEHIARLGLDNQVLRNRDEAMILPAGVSKGLGLHAALTELGLSARNAVAIGDAENDLSLLDVVEVGAAVADAVPSLKEHADLILNEKNGSGVVQLLTDDLITGAKRLCPPRRWIQLGTHLDGSAATVPGSQAMILVTGDSGAGKSHLLGAMAEQWITAGYQVLMLDPEGDHLGLAELAGVHIIRAEDPLSAPQKLVSRLDESTAASLVLDLSQIAPDDKISYLAQLPQHIAAMRALRGRPHWVILDEAHLPAGAVESLIASSGSTAWGICLATYQPGRLSSQVLDGIDITLTVGHVPSSLFGGSRQTVIMRAAGREQEFVPGSRRCPHQRHQHKYATKPLEGCRRFYFHTAPDQEPPSAGSLDELTELLRLSEPAIILYHLSRRDFSRWVGDTLANHPLAHRLAAVEGAVLAQQAINIERGRQQLLTVIDEDTVPG